MVMRDAKEKDPLAYQLSSVRLQGRHGISQRLAVLRGENADGCGELVVMSVQQDVLMSVLPTDDVLNTVNMRRCIKVIVDVKIDSPRAGG